MTISALRPLLSLPITLALLLSASCTTTQSSSDSGASSTVDASAIGDASAASDTSDSSGFGATESYEHDLPGYSWIAAGQPSQARLTELVAQGARILSLRYQSEESFDEQALVEGAGGTFIRYAVQSSAYNDQAFREALYDLYDAQMAQGGNVYMHCASSNRAGASWALYQAERKGVDAETAVRMGIDAGMRSLESMVRGILGV